MNTHTINRDERHEPSTARGNAVGARSVHVSRHGGETCVSANLRHPPRLTHVVTSPCNCGDITSPTFFIQFAPSRGLRRAVRGVTNPLAGVGCDTDRQPIPIARDIVPAAEQLRVPCGLRSGIASLASQAVSAVPVKFVRAVSRPLTFNAAHHVCQDKSDVPHCHYRTPFSSFGCYVPRLSDGAITGEQNLFAFGAKDD